MSGPREAVAIALRLHDEALAANRVHGYQMFDVSAMPSAFIGALEAQDPAFTVAAAPDPADLARWLHREALIAALPGAFQLADGLGWDSDDFTDRDTLEAVADRLLGVNRRTPALAEPSRDGGLDPERLARAMDIADDTPILATGLRRVDVVIREYARLAADGAAFPAGVNRAASEGER